MRRLCRCAAHGVTAAAFVCQHVALAGRTGPPIGFNSRCGADRASRPDAWCDGCDRRARLAGGAWVGEALAQLGVTLVCGCCYDELGVRNSPAVLGGETPP